MEEKSSSWLFTLLSTRKEIVPIIETIVFREGKTYKHLSNNFESEIQEDVAKPLQLIFSQLSSLDCPPSKVICCFFYNSSCKYIKKGEIRSTVSKNSRFLDQIQIFDTKKSLKLSSSIILDILYIKNRYKSQVFLKTSGYRKLENTFLKSSAKEIGSIIVKAIEIEQTSQILKLTLEFLTDSLDNLYLHKVNNCTLIPSSWSKSLSDKSSKDLAILLKSGKKIRTNELFQRDPEVSFQKEISVISIDSCEKEEVEEKDDGLLKVPGFLSTKSSKRATIGQRTKRRSISNSVQATQIFRSQRKNTFLDRVGSNINNFGDIDAELDDSWDYGTINVNFLELISRRAIKNSDLIRPVTPTYEEIKQKIRQINEKLSLNPKATCSLNFRSDSMRFTGDKLRKKIINDYEKINKIGYPCLTKRKIVKKKSGALPHINKYPSK